MKCLECGKEFMQVAIHIRQKHNMDPYEYRMKHNIPLTWALADDELRNHLSDKAKLRSMTQEGIDHILRIQSLSEKSNTSGKRRKMPERSIRHCLEKNIRKSKCLREEKLPGVLIDWCKGYSIRDVALRQGVAIPTLKKWVKDGYLPKRVLKYEIEET